MHAIKIEVTIDDSRQLRLTLPPETPIGKAEVFVLVTPVAQMAQTSLSAFFDELDRRPIRNPRSADAIEAQIAAERRGGADDREA